MRLIRFFLVLVTFVSLALGQSSRLSLNPAPDRSEGEGPFDRLIIRGAILIDGTGAPPRGPVDIVIEKNRITNVASVGTPFIEINEEGRPKDATKEIDADGMYVLPGLIDLHVHTGGAPKAPDAEYAYKLWLGHGITTVRGVPFTGFDLSLSEKGRSADNAITAPRMFSYHRPGSGSDDWKEGSVNDPETAKKWVRYIARKGADGMKLGAYPPDIMSALLDEATKHNLGSTAHLAQTGVAQMNAIDAARLGLGTVTHFYGLFESMYEKHDVQPWPVGMNYNDEQYRFGQVARQWKFVKPRGKKWEALLKEFKELDATLDPTMTIYSAGRDVMRARNADFHEEYTLPSMWEFYTPSRLSHGSYFFDWTTWDEVAWRNFYRVWMMFLNDYKNMGGRVTTGSDSGFIYKLYGFGTIDEMELLQEAGFHPLEVIRAATMHGAETLHKPMGKPIEFGIVREGMLADILIVDENPIQNLKVLYGTGAVRLNDETGTPERVGGVKYTIKDGIIFDAEDLRSDVRMMVRKQKREMGDRVLH
ncbi:MAG: amidohydrolase [Candidatus Marinimicrobia bacterium]|nr:amidohydrolase [Candidatus Neomarinimicrobiota bacterium]|tara:strand:+ start:807 stop:2405 length:1599 start_codon:yes stop_codon:yes gene_type:complete